MSDSTDEPWYKDGLRFECTRCGKCCTGVPGFVWVNDEEIAAIAQARGETPEHVTSQFTREASRGLSLIEKRNGDCIFWEKSKGCTIYEARPRQCRTWPFWESCVDSPADWRHTCRICPGSGQGELISAEEITRRVKVIRL